MAPVCPPPLLLLLLMSLTFIAGQANGADLNEECESGRDCLVDHSFCSDNTCKCENNFIEIDTTKCLPKVDYGEECDDFRQCLHLTPGQNITNCAYGVCRCPNSMHYVEMACWSSSYLGGACGHDNHCYQEYSSCQSNKCKCIAGYEELDSECVVELPHCELIPGAIELNGKCVCEDPDNIIITTTTTSTTTTTTTEKKCATVAFGGIGESCMEDIQCQLRMGHGAVCQGSTRACSCDFGYHYLHGLCWHSAGYGEECNADAECRAHGEWDAYACVSNACSCASDAEAKRPGVQPLCRRTSRENEECESKLDCIEGLDCDNPTSDPRGTYCYESTSYSVFNTSIDRMGGAAGTGNECGANEEPTPSGNKCVCQHGYFRLSSSAPCVPELGETCTVGSVNADIPYSLCRRSAKFPRVPSASEEEASATSEVGVWSCIGGYVPGPDNRNCHKTQKFIDRCNFEIQCGYYGGTCIGSKCICEAQYLYLADRQLCWPTSVLGEACISDEVCVVNAIDSVRCDFGGAPDGHPEGICACKSGYHAANGDCRADALSLGERCIDAIDCVFAEGEVSVTCTNGRCSCTEGYAPYNVTTCIRQ